MADLVRPLGLAPSAPSPLPPSLDYKVCDYSAPYVTQIAGFAGSEKLEAVFKKTVGAAPNTNNMHQDDDKIVLGLSPLTWLVISNTLKAAEKLDKLDRNLCAVTDLSSAKVFFEIEGNHAAIKLAKGALLDFSLAGFPVDTLCQTSIHHISVILVRTAADRFLVSTMRSFGDDLRSWLEKK